jgi:hypothetical protein
MYETAYALYIEEYPTFEFRHDTTKCHPPEGDLDTGDIRYIIQIIRYYGDLKLYLEQAYNIYHYQMWKLKKKGDKLGEALGPVRYHHFARTHPYNNNINYPNHREAYVRAHRNQWAQRFHDMEEFLHSNTSLHMSEESTPQASDPLAIPYSSPWTEDTYDPFSLDNDDSLILIPDSQEYLVEANVHAYTMSGVDDTTTLDVQLLAAQNTRPLPDTTGYQPYDPGTELPTLPTMNEIK